MTDREDIQRLIYLYGHVIDDMQWNRLDEIFAEDGCFEIEGTDISVSGFDAIDKFMRSITHPLAHYTTNVLVDVEEGTDVATARAKVFAPRANGTSAIGSYHDVIVRTERGWRFQRRLVKAADLYWRSAPLDAS